MIFWLRNPGCDYTHWDTVAGCRLTFSLKFLFKFSRRPKMTAYISIYMTLNQNTSGVYEYHYWHLLHNKASRLPLSWKGTWNHYLRNNSIHVVYCYQYGRVTPASFCIRNISLHFITSARWQLVSLYAVKVSMTQSCRSDTCSISLLEFEVAWWLQHIGYCQFHCFWQFGTFIFRIAVCLTDEPVCRFAQ